MVQMLGFAEREARRNHWIVVWYELLTQVLALDRKVWCQAVCYCAGGTALFSD